MSVCAEGPLPIVTASPCWYWAGSIAVPSVPLIVLSVEDVVVALVLPRSLGASGTCTTVAPAAAGCESGTHGEAVPTVRIEADSAPGP